MRLPLPTLVVACLALGGLGACGDTQSNPEDPSGESPGGAHSDAQVAATDSARVQRALETIRQRCEEAGADEAQTIVEVYRIDPEALLLPSGGGQGRSMTTVVEDARDRLSGCDQDDLAAELDQALEET